MPEIFDFIWFYGV